MKTQTMKGSPYAKVFLSNIIDWEAKLLKTLGKPGCLAQSAGCMAISGASVFLRRYNEANASRGN